MPDITRIEEILKKHLDSGLDENERAELEIFLATSPAVKVLFEQLNDPAALQNKMQHFYAIKEKELSVQEGDKEPTELYTAPVHRVHFLRRAWVRYAAAILIIVGVGTYLYINTVKEKPSVTQVNPVPVQNDVAPGGNKAVLTLADGTTIILDSAANGTIAQQSDAVIKKQSDGEILYSKIKNNIPSPREGSGVGSTAYAVNTMTTPRGGQYKITLPDKTQVWLNAESSITYPTSFAERERRVSVTGEVYFEVAKDKKKFIVSVSPAGGGGPQQRTGGGPDDEMTSSTPSKKEKNIPSLREGSGVGSKSLEIEVLGTHFNIKSYSDENEIATTLLEGSIKISAKANSVHTLILKPGQQGQLKDQQLSLAAKPDLEQVMAWKEGRFYFNQEDLRSILRQFARWYDVEVIYEGQLKNRKFFGIVSKNSSLAEVLKLLKDSDIRFRIEGRKLYVLSD